MLQIFALMTFSLLTSFGAYGFPENIRHGYASCKSCHYSPTGGGVLTPYGRRLNEEIQNTWSSEKEADFGHGFFAMPEFLQIGGDFRRISYKREAKTYRESRSFLMQADVEAVFPKFWDQFTAAVNGGYYDEQGRLRKAYLMYDFNESIALRVGLFMPAFGINTPEHEIATKRPLQFNEGSEVPSLEFSYMNRLFEIFATGFSGDRGENMKRDTGATLTGAFYLGNRSKVGVSVYSGDSEIQNRLIVGPYAIIGFTEHLYLLSEVDYQNRTIKNREQALIDDEEGLFAYNKFGWEVIQGFHAFLTYETARPSASEKNGYFDGYGGGMTWFPRPHFEFQLSYESTRDPGVERTDGEMYLAMMHYYL